MQKTTLIAKVLIEEDIRVNSEGLDQTVLTEAVKTQSSDFSKPMAGDELLLELLGTE